MPCVLRNGLDQDGPDPGDIGGLQRPQHRIAQKGAAEPASLSRAIHRQPADHHHRHRVRHVAPRPPRRRGMANRPGCEGVIPDYPAGPPSPKCPPPPPPLIYPPPPPHTTTQKTK